MIDESEVCDDGVANSDVQPNACRSTCVLYRCGDGVRDLGESCDDGLDNSDEVAVACRTNCALPSCGDGVVDLGESCDEGSANSDEVADACRTTCVAARCGDGVIDEGEVCDDGAANSDVQPNACRTTCVAARCGDGTRDLGEGCDNGTLNDDAVPGACRTSCALPSCGDGVVDLGESCDEGAANSDEVAGACRTTCVPARCGDGVIDEGEACDDGVANSDVQPNACRTTCVPSRCGDGVRDLGESCDDGTLNDDTVPGACRTSCALPSCGDGVVDLGESCDEGPANSDEVAGACRTTCVPARCGDGVIDEGEACDDGVANSDVQPNACRTTCVAARCGDGTRDLGEGCDNGTLNDDAIPGACRTSCALPSCGDGVVDLGESCDEGVANSDEVAGACRTTCVPARCGDGVIDEGEACDDGVANSDVQPNACRTTCVAARCGDGTRDLGEGCDNGTLNDDTVPGACRTSCALPSCGDGVVDLGESCDEGPANSDEAADACRTSCVEARCGDGVIDEGEACDDGVANSDVQPNACRTTCVAARCGDGTRDLGEGCDDGVLNDDTVPGACRTSCALPSCGDGVVDSDEVCDDHNRLSGDGCRNDCDKVEVCGDQELDEGEACDDGNVNPADGCDECREQLWTFDLVVSGSTEGRDPRGMVIESRGVAVDALDRIYFTSKNRVYRIDKSGATGIIAGTGEDGPLGDGGAAALARISAHRLIVDPLGRVYISGDYRVRRVELDGTIVTVAGTGTYGFSGDGGPATEAQIASNNMAMDRTGRLYISGGFRVRRVELDGTIVTVAGNGTYGFSGDGGPAIEAQINTGAIAVDPEGRLYISTATGVSGHYRVRRVELDGTIVTVAGTGTRGFSGDGGPAIEAEITAGSIAVDPVGRLYLGGEGRVRRVETDGTIVSVAGNGSWWYHGYGPVPATSVGIWPSASLAFDSIGNLYIASNAFVRRVDAQGTLDTVAGSLWWESTPQGSMATSTRIGFPRDVAIDSTGRVYIADSKNDQILRLDGDGTIVTLAAPEQLNGPCGIALDAQDRLYIADTYNHRILREEADGTFVTVAGTGTGDFSEDGGLATETHINRPYDIALDTQGRLYIADTKNHRILRVDPSGIVVTVAGTGTPGFSGDGGLATEAQLAEPHGLAFDAAGRLYIADYINARVRRVELDGTIGTLAGTGDWGFNGDGQPAIGAQLDDVNTVDIDAQGRVYIADTYNSRIRRIDAQGIIETVAGTGDWDDYANEGGAATGADLTTPHGIALDDEGRMYIADSDGFRVRRVELDGTIMTIAGLIHPVGPGFADRAKLYPPAALAWLPNQLFSVGGFGRMLRTDLSTQMVTVVAGFEDPNSVWDFLAAPEVQGLARFAPPLEEARGIAWDPEAQALMITEFITGDIRVISLDPDQDGNFEPTEQWTNTRLSTGLVGPAGIVYDDVSDSFVIAEEANHCVVRISRAGDLLETVYGDCGVRGRFPGFLNEPSHVALSPLSGAIYVSDTGNQRVLRVDEAGDATLVLGDGSISSAGDGTPARLFPVDSPQQLALDEHGNLFVTSSTTLRMVANVDGDADADGDDRVTTLYGGGERLTFPESDAYCLRALALGEAGSIHLADTCQGYMVTLSRELAQ